MPDVILHPTDGTDPARRATERAMDMAERDDATVHVLFVVDTKEYGEPALSSSEVLVSEREDAGRDLLADIAEQARERGVDVETICCHGDPRREILDRAAELGADVIVMGLRGDKHERTAGSVTKHVRRNHEQVVVEA